MRSCDCHAAVFAIIRSSGAAAVPAISTTLRPVAPAGAGCARAPDSSAPEARARRSPNAVDELDPAKLFDCEGLAIVDTSVNEPSVPQGVGGRAAKPRAIHVR